MLSVKTLIAESSALSRQVAVTLRSCSSLDTESLHIPELWTVNTEFQCPAQHIGENENCDHLQGLEFPDIEHGEIKLLIDGNVPQAHIQSEVRVGQPNQPIAVQTLFGWSLMGAINRESDTAQVNINLISAAEKLHNQVQNFWLTESFGVSYDKCQNDESEEDRRALRILENTTNLTNGHYEVGMLWKKDKSNLPVNISVARSSFNTLIRQIQRDEKFKEQYIACIEGYISKDYARKLTPSEENKISPRTWYLQSCI